MKRFSIVVFVGIGLLAGACASQMDGGMTAGTAKKSPYDRLGQKPAITAVVDDFIGNVAADNRINKSKFKVPGEEQKELLTALGGMKGDIVGR